jgi:hypothetical protein
MFRLELARRGLGAIETDGRSHSLTYVFGANSDEETLFFMTVGLVPQPTLVHEFLFYVTRRDAGTGHEERFWGGSVPPFQASIEERRIIRYSVLLATEMILDHNSPPVVEMVTRDVDLPPKALEKYDMLSDVFAYRGYRVLTEETYLRKKLWKFERVDQTPGGE